MRRLALPLSLLFALSAFACNRRKAGGDQPAPTPEEARAGKNEMANCPSAVPGAVTAVADLPDGVEVRVIGFDDATTAEIRRRAAILAAAAGAPGKTVRHTGQGTGGGGTGRCPITAAGDKLTVEETDGGSRVVVRPASADDVVVAQRAARDRARAFASSGDQIKVAAAADLTFAFGEIGKAFTAKSGIDVTFSFGSTGQLAAQIREGGPFDLFAAANASFVDDVVTAGACDGATKAQYARGKIVVWVAKGVTTPPAALADLSDPRFAKIAIANPEHAPYGKAAKQALQKAGLWDELEPRIVYGENIKQTMQFAETGNAEAAIVALSLAIVSENGAALPIDDSLYDPIDQALIVCKHGGEPAAARAFAAFVASPEGRAIMERFGFALPR